MVWNDSSRKIKLDIVQTGTACPEQYEVFTKDGKQVGYIRLRHGHFRVECPEWGGVRVYNNDNIEAECGCDGCFDEVSRKRFMKIALKHITKWVELQK
jgi:hypothetical protein